MGDASKDKLYEIAESQAGHFTLKDAAAAGYSRALIRYHVKRGHFQPVFRGVYRIVHYPSSPQEDLVAAWLWSDQLGVISHQTALSLHGLSDVLPSRIHTTVPRKWGARRRVPSTIRLHLGDVPPTEQEWLGSVPVTTPLRTVVDCARAHVQPELVSQAAQEGIARRLFLLDALPADIAATVRRMRPEKRPQS